MTLNERIGFEMRSRRLLKRMTLEEVAKGMGFASKNTVSRMDTIILFFVRLCVFMCIQKCL